MTAAAYSDDRRRATVRQPVGGGGRRRLTVMTGGAPLAGNPSVGEEGMKKEEEGVLWSFHQWMKGDIRGSPFF
jgi:hypothetical protein